MQLAKAAALLALAASSIAWAGPQEAYTAARFDQLAKEGKPVLVAVHADWCPTCKAQKPIVKELMGAPGYKDVTELTVDFDKDKPAVQRFKAGMQSTMVAFKGGKEVGRSVGDTTKAGLESLVKKAAE
ncbi:thioredoxin family protein [Ramlibacter sp.]|uniref:thioredoxin family protein n=1 Tax=Ramlibacter sp. TaxID=1917967 RepID=UPI00180EF4B8|nr:thioredoxin family protein [Ramlibacter sp.]MBA2673356.1 thioredoxin family protein [Ramlibacter sp.]